MTKAEARKALMMQRAAAHQSEPATTAPRILQAMAAWLEAQLAQGQTLGTYQSIRTERDPAPLVARLSCTQCSPRVMGPDLPLNFYTAATPQDFETGSFGVLEPRLDLPVVMPDVLLVPLVGFDAQGFRLGYGGGFYDRTLALLRETKPLLALGFAYDGQLSAQRLDFEATDQRLDCILTPTRRIDHRGHKTETHTWV